MARRASSSNHPLWIVVVLLLVAVAIGGGYLLVGRVNDPFRTVAALDVNLYLDNSNSLRGNTYKVKGTVLNSLAWSPEVGRLFSVEVESEKSASSSGVLPILIPTEFNHINIQKGQRFFFKLEVDDKGILKARGLQKT